MLNKTSTSTRNHSHHHFEHPKVPQEVNPHKSHVKYTLLGFLLIVITMALIFSFNDLPLYHNYSQEQPTNILAWPFQQLSLVITYDLFHIPFTGKYASWGEASFFFFSDVPFILFLFTMFIYLFNFVRAFSSNEEFTAVMSKWKGFRGRVVGMSTGAIFPFCACSFIPMFISLSKNKVPFSSAMAFLITAPMVNEIGITLMFGYFGWKVTLLYVLFGLTISMLGSYVAVWLKLEGSLLIDNNSKHGKHGKHNYSQHEHHHEGSGTHEISFSYFHKTAWFNVKDNLKKYWLIVVFAILVSSLIYGLVPPSWIRNHVGNSWWAPLAVITFGLLLYLNITVTIPVAFSFWNAGLSIGSTVGFMMAVNTISPPEIMILARLMRRKLMFFFITYLVLSVLIFAYIMYGIQFSHFLPLTPNDI